MPLDLTVTLIGLVVGIDCELVLLPFPFAGALGRPSHRNSVDSLPEGRDQGCVYNGGLRIESLRPWLSSYRRKTVNLSARWRGK